MYVYMLPQTTFGHGLLMIIMILKLSVVAIWGTPPLKTVTFGLSVNF